MGIFSRIKDLFKEKEIKEEAEDIKLLNPENSQIEEVQKQDGKRYVEHQCEICNQIIGKDHYSKFCGHWFHKSCAKKKKREVLNGYR